MDKEYWFSKKSKQFLKNIDTFYYAVYFKDSFFADDHSEPVEKLRKFCDDLKKDYESKDVSFSDQHVIFQAGAFSVYNVRFTAPDFFDFFVAPVVYSKDSPIAVMQLRSRCLWEDGVYAAFDESFEFVQAFAQEFGLTITEVKENRCDFACHSNALSDPESFFEQKHFAKMWVGQVGRTKEKTKHFFQHTTVYDDDSIETDYISIGKRGSKCFIRIYLKSKEVVQEGYKGFFLKLWLLSGLISRYDMYCLEEAYKRKSWAYVDIARLEWALQYDDTIDQVHKDFIRSVINADKVDINLVHKTAKTFCEPVTKIFNIEFQCMRDMSKSFQLIPRNNHGVCGRVYDYLDNYDLIYEYLTRVSLRLTRTDQPDLNKSRRDNCYFWDRLRSAKTVDFKKKHKDLHLIRKYTSNVNLEVRKKRALSALCSLDIAYNKDPNTRPVEAAELLLSIINDNDIDYFDRHTRKLLVRNAEDIPDNTRRRSVRFIAIDPESDSFY